MGQRVAIVGVGQTHHTSVRRDVNGIELINEAVMRALDSAELTIHDIDAIIIGNMDHFEAINGVDTWSVDGCGAFMKPIMKLTTGGTTGTTVATGAYHHVASGFFDTVLAIGWEKNSESDTTGAIITCTDPIWERFSYSGALPSLAAEATAYMKAYGVTERDAARVAVRDRNHASLNPFAHLRDKITVDDVMNSPMYSYPIKLLDICPRTDGACAVVFASESRAKRMTSSPAWVLATTSRHEYAWLSDIDYTRMVSLEGACREAYKLAGIRDPGKEIDVVELYQPYSFAGLKWMEAMGVCRPGEAAQLVWDGVTDLGGEIPFNPSGGVLATNCIGATALLRVGEAALQVQGKAGAHQVPDVKLAVATGFGGAFWSDVVVLGREPR
ncbi:MAG: thiolase family protein [Chloroflexota bacterium]|nr:MAG: thiolase family protein [Chloroflexota bacterium]